MSSIIAEVRDEALRCLTSGAGGWKPARICLGRLAFERLLEELSTPIMGHASEMVPSKGLMLTLPNGRPCAVFLDLWLGDMECRLFWERDRDEDRP